MPPKHTVLGKRLFACLTFVNLSHKLVMSKDLRHVIGSEMQRFLSHYQPTPMSGVQREFH